MARGLGQPRHSRAYKAAVIELQRLSAPASAVLLPVLAVALLAAMSDSAAVQERIAETRIIEVDTVVDLTPVEEYAPPEKFLLESFLDDYFPVIDGAVSQPGVDVPGPVSSQPVNP